MFKFLIHFAIIFVYSIRKGPNFILLPVFPTPFIEKIIFFPLSIIDSLVK